MLVSFIASATYANAFELTFSLVGIHLFLVLTARIVLLSLCSLVLIPKNRLNPPILARTTYSVLNACIAIFLYFTYLFSFGGKINQNRSFTFEMMLGYGKYLNQVAESVFENGLIVYTVVIGVPITIFVLVASYSWLISNALTKVRGFLLKHSFTNPPAIAKINIVLFLLSLGYFTRIVSSDWKGFKRQTLNTEEPIVSVLYNRPIQGHQPKVNTEDAAIRDSYPKDIPFEHKNVILIVIDALRPDHLRFNGYHRKTSPFLDSLYASGNLHKVELALSTAASSFPGISALLYSKIWSHIGMFDFSLQQLLKDQGYKVNFLLSGDHTHFYNLRNYYERGIRSNFYIDGSTTKQFVINDDRIILEGLEQIKPYSSPSFFHLHLNSVHPSGIRFNDFKKYQPAPKQSRVIEHFTNNYDNGILQADSYLKLIFKKLEHKGYLQNSIVIITADHGEGLGEKGNIGHGNNVYTNQLLIPILVYDTDSVNYLGLETASILDIAPTIIDRLGLPIPTSWEGESLLKASTRPYTFHHWKEHQAIIRYCENSIYKYIYNRKKKTEELYNLTEDLFENNDIIKTVDDSLLRSFRTRRKAF